MVEEGKSLKQYCREAMKRMKGGFWQNYQDTDEYNRPEPLNGTSYTIDDPSVSISYTLYRPKAATSTNPYPVVFVVPGFTRTKATMSQYAIELARRGAVVFTIDPGSQGGTTYGGYEADEEGNYILTEDGNK